MTRTTILVSNKNQSVCIYMDGDELDKLNDRLSEIKDLERKYGNTIEDILVRLEKLENELKTGK